MEIEHIDLFLFTFHVALLMTKVWFALTIIETITIVDTPKENSKMMVFRKYEIYLFLLTLTTVFTELYFLYIYFMADFSLMYEYIAIVDQIVLSLLIINYFKKGGLTDG